MSVSYFAFGHSFEKVKNNVRNTHNSSLITHPSQKVISPKSPHTTPANTLSPGSDWLSRAMLATSAIPGC